VNNIIPHGSIPQAILNLQQYYCDNQSLLHNNYELDLKSFFLSIYHDKEKFQSYFERHMQGNTYSQQQNNISKNELYQIINSSYAENIITDKEKNFMYSIIFIIFDYCMQKFQNIKVYKSTNISIVNDKDGHISDCLDHSTIESDNSYNFSNQGRCAIF
jgi:hypothetical protein